MPITGFKTIDFLKPIEIKSTVETRDHSVVKDAFETLKTALDFLKPKLPPHEFSKLQDSMRIVLETKGIKFAAVSDDTNQLAKQLQRVSLETATHEPTAVIHIHNETGHMTLAQMNKQTGKISIFDPNGASKTSTDFATSLRTELPTYQVSQNTTNYHEVFQEGDPIENTLILNTMALEHWAQGKELSEQPLAVIKQKFQETKTRLNNMRQQIMANRVQAQIQGTAQLQQASPALMAEISSLPVSKADKALLQQLASNNPKMADLIAAYVKNPTAAAYAQLTEMANKTIKDSATNSEILAFLKSISDAFTQRAPKSSKSGSNRRSK